MKIAILFDNFGPYHIARLRALNAHCDLLALEVHAHSAEYSWSAEPVVPFNKVTLCPRKTGKKWLKLRRKLTDALSGFRPDVVLIPGWSSKAALEMLLWASRQGVPAVLMSDSQEIDFPRNQIKEGLKKVILTGYSAALVAGSPHAEYVKKLGIPANAIRMGYDVVDNDYFAQGAIEATSKQYKRQGLPKHFFLSVARFVEKKNLPILIKAYSQYHERLDRSEVPIDLVLLGDGELRDDLHQLARSLRVDRYIHFNGFRQYSELPLFYGLAHTFILPSLVEQWGLVVNEAMASGLPVLVSDRCGAKSDLVQEGVNGFTFPPDDITALADRMLSMARLPAEKMNMMKYNSRRIIDDWTLEKFCESVMELSEIAKNSSRHGLPMMVSGALKLVLR
nr:glycosyltransferase [uncultured Celeribacter sp.]